MPEITNDIFAEVNICWSQTVTCSHQSILVGWMCYLLDNACVFILVTENKNMCSWCGVCFHASGKWNYRHQNKARTKEGVQFQWIKKKQKYRGLISCLNSSSGLNRNKQMYPLRFLPQLCPSVSLELSHRISVHTKHEWVSSDTYQK